MTRSDDANIIVAVDFDFTLAVPAFINDPDPEPMPGAREFLQRLQDEGFIVVIFSARSWAGWPTTKYTHDMEQWLEKHRMPYNEIAFSKPPALAYVDDKAVEFTGDFAEVISRLLLRKRVANWGKARG